jgi:hypothetical protein
VASCRDDLMDFLALKQLAHDCDYLFSEQRWALTGDAGAFLDPFYSPGSDFIAMANLMIGALVERDLKKRPIGAQVEFFNRTYFSLFNNTMRIYEGQYPLFGNGAVMIVKILWDYATYWSFPAYLCVQGYLTDPLLQQEIQPIVEEFGDINARMQAFFRHWHEAWQPDLHDMVIDQSDVKILSDLNGRLLDKVDKPDFPARMAANLKIWKELAAEIVVHAATTQADLSLFMLPDQDGDTSHFEVVWQALGLPVQAEKPALSS